MSVEARKERKANVGKNEVLQRKNVKISCVLDIFNKIYNEYYIQMLSTIVNVSATNREFR